ncbi:unnamed protein product [Amoebophrya sp. A120]|nr:unnamed protein product [Amoebophrya sp. A120]|eukprot:GSA120T00023965001.1
MLLRDLLQNLHAESFICDHDLALLVPAGGSMISSSKSLQHCTRDCFSDGPRGSVLVVPPQENQASSCSAAKLQGTSFLSTVLRENETTATASSATTTTRRPQTRTSFSYSSSIREVDEAVNSLTKIRKDLHDVDAEEKKLEEYGKWIPTKKMISNDLVPKALKNLDKTLATVNKIQ